MIKQITLIAVLLVLGQWLYAQREVRVRLFADPDMQQFIDAAEVRADNVGFQPKRLGKGLYKLTFPGLADGQEVVLSVLKDGYAVVNPHVLRFNAPGNNTAIIDVVMCTLAKVNDCKVEYYAISIEQALRKALTEANSRRGLMNENKELRKKIEDITNLLRDKNQIRERARELARIDREKASERIVLALDAFTNGDIQKAQVYIWKAQLPSRYEQFMRTEDEQKKERATLINDLKTASVIAQYALQGDSAMYYLKKAYQLDSSNVDIAGDIIALGISFERNFSYLNELLPIIERSKPRTEKENASKMALIIVGRMNSKNVGVLIDNLFNFCTKSTSIDNNSLAGYYLRIAWLCTILNEKPDLVQSAITRANALIATIHDPYEKLNLIISLIDVLIKNKNIKDAGQVLSLYEKTLSRCETKSERYALYLAVYAASTQAFTEAVGKDSRDAQLIREVVHIAKNAGAYFIKNKKLLNQSYLGYPGYFIWLGMAVLIWEYPFDKKETYFQSVKDELENIKTERREDYYLANSVIELILGQLASGKGDKVTERKYYTAALNSLKNSLQFSAKYAVQFPGMFSIACSGMTRQSIDSFYRETAQFIKTIKNADSRIITGGYFGLSFLSKNKKICDSISFVCDSLLQIISDGYTTALRKNISDGFSIETADFVNKGFEAVIDKWLSQKQAQKALQAAEIFYKLSKQLSDSLLARENLIMLIQHATPALLFTYVQAGFLERPFTFLDSLFSLDYPFSDNNPVNKALRPQMINAFLQVTLGGYADHILEDSTRYKDTVYIRRLIRKSEELAIPYLQDVNDTEVSTKELMKNITQTLQEYYDILLTEMRKNSPVKQKAYKRLHIINPGYTATKVLYWQICFSSAPTACPSNFSKTPPGLSFPAA